MKIISLCVLLIVALQYNVRAQSSDERAVAQKTEMLGQAILHPDKAILTDLTCDELSYGHSGGKVQNKTQFVDDLVNGSFHFLTLDITDQTIVMAGKEAIVRQTMNFDFSNNGTTGHLKVGNMLVWKKVKKQWKLLARQAFKI